MNDQKTNALDALAEAALDAYYSDARIAIADRNDDDAAWLLAGTYDDASERVDAHENNTGAECARWRSAVMDYYLIRDGAPQGMTATDYAAAIEDLHMLDDSADVRAACIAIATTERDTWDAISKRADATAGDDTAAMAWDAALESMEAR